MNPIASVNQIAEEDPWINIVEPSADASTNAKARKDWPEKYPENKERDEVEQNLDFALQNLIRKAFTVFSF